MPQTAERYDAMSMRFIDAGQAIKWAEEYASRPDVGSQIGKMMRGLGGGGEPVFDVALSISAMVAECKPKAASVAAKAIYGAPDSERDGQVAWLLGEQIRRLECASRRPVEQMQALALATLKAERASMIYGDRYPDRRMAFDCGVSHTAFRKNFEWLDMRREAVETLRLWLDQVHRQVEDYLTERGWMARDEA